MSMHLSNSTQRPDYLAAIIPIIVALIILTACHDHLTPDNYEPTIESLETSDITRTEATISARVHKRGTTDLTYLTFRYGESGNINREVQLSEPGNEIQTCRLQELKPGTSYSWYVEGGTTTAILRSETRSFITYPNERPQVSPLVTLSTGPIGIIVSFKITDDGGEPLLEAGCEVVDSRTQQKYRIYLNSGELKEGEHRLHIGGLSIETTYTITPFASNSVGESIGQPLEYTTRNSIVLDEAGSLPYLFEGSESIDLSMLTISGPMNGDDFRFIRLLLGAPLMPGQSFVRSTVTSVDLTDAHIVEGGRSYDGNRFTRPDELSIGLLADCVNLYNISLPSTARILARDAFARCISLGTLTISANIENVLPSSECTLLEAISVSEANQCYSSVDGVLFNRDGSSIIWFPLGKTGAYTLPSTITTIGENAFLGTAITSLVIPSSVTSICRGAFAWSSLTEITLPENITNISEGMFQNCTYLTTVHLGKSTEFIGNYVFDGTYLKDLYIGATIPPFTTEEAFFNRASSITESCTLHVPTGSKAVYRNHSKWGRFNKIEEF